jgi:type IV pilus assembly protein PilB
MAGVLATHAPPPSRLGELLVSTGSITPAQLERALDDQQRIKRPLGQTLLALGFVTDETMRQALGAQLNVPYIDLDRVVLDRGLADLVDREFAERHLLMPVARIGPTLTVAMDDPTASAVVEALAKKTGLTINVVTSSARAIADAFSRAYGAPSRPDPSRNPRRWRSRSTGPAR